MIEIKEKIPQGLKGEIKVALDKRLGEVSQKDIQKVNSEIEAKTLLISKSHQFWERKIAVYAEALFKIVETGEATMIEEMEPFQLLIYATLNYFVDDFDLIPDYIMQDGYVDDALMINLCVKRLPKEQKNVFYSHVSQDSL
ncbi:hypothetical protein SPONL_1509 [uncultured Candidatus Thioglobus sp.]|nr:hypothetical protein SPONL_1509 [uncultured Candidatus Thioglobus sp.]